MVSRTQEIKKLKRSLNICLAVLMAAVGWFGFSVAMLLQHVQ